MTSLVAAIRESVSDQTLSRHEIDNLVEIAAREDGVSAAELGEILSSFEQTDDGFTPAHRAQLWVRLTGLPTNPKRALKLLKLHLHPITVHFPQALFTFAPIFLILFYIFHKGICVNVGLIPHTTFNSGEGAFFFSYFDTFSH